MRKIWSGNSASCRSRLSRKVRSKDRRIRISQARKAIADERKNGTLINGCGLTKAKSAIFLDNGQIASSPLTVRRLMASIDKALTKANVRIDKRMQVYDVYDEEPDENDEETEDVSAEYEDEEYEDDYEE